MSEAPLPDGELDELVEHIRASRGVDLTVYKRGTLSRRVRKRMADAGMATVEEYRDLLEAHVDEFAALLDTILINVTGFFRDKPAWDFLAEEVIPAVLARKRPGEPLRAWSAGCSSGEEPYTLAMVLAETIGTTDLRPHAKIYATDVDDGALAQARSGAYTDKELADLPEVLRDRYLVEAGARMALRPGLRRAVIFGHHDLAADAPIGRLDLLVCRNTMMYFNRETQARVLDRFQFALEDEGYLFLGRAEMLLSHADLFAPVSMRHRVFRKATTAADQQLGEPRLPDPGAQQVRMTRHLRLREMAADSAPLAQVVVDADGTLVAANAAARSLFGLTSNDVSQPLHNLELSYRPVELRSRLEQVYSEHRSLHLRSVEHLSPHGEAQYLDVTLVPLVAPDDSLAGATVTFADVTPYHRLRNDLQRSREELETTYEELRSTNEELETTNEELQSTNEELQSTNEELETTNEELHSSNEELETTNEELQSSNEELETMNEELRSTNEEIESSNETLQSRAAAVATTNEQYRSLLAGLPSAVVMVGRDLSVQMWNQAAETLWGVAAETALGRPLASLGVGLPVDQLRPAVDACLDGRSDREALVVDAQGPGDQPVRLEVICTPIGGPPPAPGAVLVVDRADR